MSTTRKKVASGSASSTRKSGGKARQQDNVPAADDRASHADVIVTFETRGGTPSESLAHLFEATSQHEPEAVRFEVCVCVSMACSDAGDACIHIGFEAAVSCTDRCVGLFVWMLTVKGQVVFVQVAIPVVQPLWLALCGYMDCNIQCLMV